MKDKKWARKLDRELVGKILESDFQQVVFEPDRKDGTTYCRIYLGTKVYQGLSICSTIEKFDEVKGKNKSLGRAYAAYEKGISSMAIRKDLSEFPLSWTRRQIERVMAAGSLFKSHVII